MKYKINLLTLKKEKLFDRVIYFVLNYLRYILVMTQIVVIGVFFYRFKVDQDLVDLQEAADQKKEIIKVSQPLIKEAKKEAFKLDQAQSIMTSQHTLLEAIDYLLSIFPENFFLNKMQISEDTISMAGFTQDPQTIKDFLNRLKKETKFKKIELQNIKKGEAGLEFSFELSKYNSTSSF
ncbi:PilN domain-containing protein [Candidatus Roizmanbacteria bacterium]|nr:PilN domain-containing protein [Candidatus Roizmanbacteria bacterium]